MYMQQNPNWGITALVEAIRSRNEGRANAKALTSLYAPIEPNMADNTFQDLSTKANPNSNYTNKAGAQQAQGLLPTGFQPPTSDMIGQGLLGQPKPQVQQPRFFNQQANPDIQPAVTPAMGQYSNDQKVNPVSVTSTPKTWAGIQKDITAQGYDRIKQMAKTMSPEMLRTYLPEANRLIKEQIALSKGEYDKNIETQAWTNFDKAPDYKTKMMTGIKAGLNPQLLKMALDTGIEIKTQDVGDKIISYGVDTHNNKLIDLVTGKELDPSIFTKGISAAQQEQFNITREGHEITRQGQKLTAGRYGTSKADTAQITNAKYAIAKHEDWMVKHTNKITGEAPDERQSPYHKYVGQANQVLDGYFGLGGQNAEQSVGNTGDSRIDGMIANMRNGGAPEQIINDMVWEEQNKTTQPKKPRQDFQSYTGIDYGQDFQGGD